MGKWKKIGSAAFVAILVFLVFATIPIATASPDEVIYVPDDFEMIQWAVDNASAGDTIIVRDDTYTENVDVNVDNLTIKSENGTTNCIVQAANPDDHVFEVTADYVNITGFTVEGATGAWKAGIYLSDYKDHCTISNNFVSNNRYGILSWYSNDNTISNNTISDNYCGINLYSSSSNTITNNIFENDGILIMGWKLSHYNTHVVEDNTINEKPIYYYKNTNGITVPEDAGEVILANCTDMIVENINASVGTVGIELAFTAKSKILENNVNSNSYYGIYSVSSSNDMISDNNVSNNYCGISLYSSSNNNIITNNTVNSNNYSGIYLYSSSNNNNITGNTASSNEYGILSWSSNNNHIYHNNLINNTNQAYDNTGTNTWDNGYPSGGNYWSDYTENYPDAEEIDESGIWNTPYDVLGDAGAQDRYPLIEPWGDKLKIIINEPTPYSAYPQGTNLTFNVTVYSYGKPLDANQTIVTAYLLGPSGIKRQINLHEKRNNYNIGEFYLSFNYPKGFWSVRFGANDSEGNTASKETTILITDAYLIQASTDRIAYTLNDTISLMARVINVRPLKAMNDSDVNLTLSIIADNGTLLYEMPLVSDDNDNFKYNLSAGI